MPSAAQSMALRPMLSRSGARLLLLLLLLLVPAWAPAVAIAAAPAAPAPPFAVFGYLPEYRTHKFDYEGAFQTGLTHLIYFSIEVDPVTHLPTALDRLPPKEEILRARQAADRVGGKLLLGFGGNARSQGFAEMTATPQLRATFLTALDRLLMDLRLDGVDYNWEYPRSEQEWRNWGALMTETKTTVLGGDPARNIVTFTMYLDPQHYRVLQHFNLLETADYVHCMAYDAPGKHSTMAFAKKGIALAESHFPGALLRKWTLGVPFYARHTSTGEPKNFYDISKHIRNNRSNNGPGGVYYNSQETLKNKTLLAMRSGVGGIMIWELGQDVQPLSEPESLMQGIHAALRQAQQGLADGAKEEL